MHLILETNGDLIIYDVASLIALGSFLCFHCYFMGKESYLMLSSLSEDLATLLVLDSWNELQLLWYNSIYTSDSLFTHFRYVK